MTKQTMAKEAAEAKARDTKAAEANAAKEAAERFARRSRGVRTELGTCFTAFANT